MVTPRLGPTDSQLLASVGQALIVTDTDGCVTSWNPAAERMYGWTAQEAVGRSINDLTVPVGSQPDAADVLADVRAGRPWSGTFTVRHADGSTFRALVTTSGVVGDDGELLAFVGVSRPLAEALRPLLERSSDAMTLVDREGVVRYASPAVTHVFGWDARALAGQPLADLVHPDDRPLLDAVLHPERREDGAEVLELRVRAEDGGWRWAEASVSDLVGDSTVRGLVVNLRDVTDRRAAHERLTHLALHDPLTGLANRALVLDRLHQARARRGRDGALLLVDLDDLKAVNARLGHAAGDELLRTVAARLDAAVGVQDTCGRIGGDELLVLAEGVRDPAGALELAHRLQAAIGRAVRLDGSTETVSASIGLTLLDGRHRSHELLRECVVAVNDAKRSGPGRVAVFRSLGIETRPEGGLLERLREGLSDGEVCVHYQPVVDLGSGAAVGVEALVRWDHPHQGLLGAEDFMDAVEGDDLVNDLGAFVLDAACRQVQAWPDPALSVSVNVSARQLADRSLGDVVEASLSRSGLAPERLVLEITETALTRDLATALAVLGVCRRRGVRVSLDDFGTGFTGFGYLRELPVDELKVDRSFVSGLGTSPSDAAIVAGILQLSRGLGLRTTAEGVETPRQAAVLTALGCDRGQGHLWSPAVAAGPLPPAVRRTA